MTPSTSLITYKKYQEILQEIGPSFLARAVENDMYAAFVSENYRLLKQHRFFSMMVPVEFGGAGLSYEESCSVIRSLARYCASTALALSMHQHLVAANVWKYRNGKGGQEVLMKIGKDQLILVSTGAKDWLDSSGEMEKVRGGYLFSAHKNFASQSVVGDLLVTSGPYLDPELGPQVLHFGIPFQTEGVSLLDDWDTLGMRATGSQTVKLDKVFIPESAIKLRRAQGEYHPVWNIVLGVAMPLIMSVYVGIAEQASEIALNSIRNAKDRNPYTPYALGEMNNLLETARVMHQDMLRLNANYTFEPKDEVGQKILSRKTVIANACIETVQKAMEICGGRGFKKELGLERLFRDVQAAKYHPLPEKEQWAFSGEYLLDT